MICHSGGILVHDQHMASDHLPLSPRYPLLVAVNCIYRELEFYEFFSFLKFYEFYDFFSVEKNSQKFVILQIIDV